MLEHIKYFVTGAVSFTIASGLLLLVAWMLAEHLLIAFILLLVYPTYLMGKKIVDDYRDTVKTYGKDWWKN